MPGSVQSQLSSMPAAEKYSAVRALVQQLERTKTVMSGLISVNEKMAGKNLSPMIKSKEIEVKLITVALIWLLKDLQAAKDPLNEKYIMNMVNGYQRIFGKNLETIMNDFLNDPDLQTLKPNFIFQGNSVLEVVITELQLYQESKKSKNINIIEDYENNNSARTSQQEDRGFWKKIFAQIKIWCDNFLNILQNKNTGVFSAWHPNADHASATTQSSSHPSDNQNHQLR